MPSNDLVVCRPPPPAFSLAQHQDQAYRKVERTPSKHSSTHHLESTINILLYLLYLVSSSHLIVFKVHNRHEYSSIFAYESLAGIIFKVEFPRAIMELLK